MGTSLNGLTPAGTYPGLIKTGDNAPIDGTLKTLSDGNGNNLPMSVSTSTINLTGTAQVGGVAIANTTQVAAKQDTLVSGTNIKTINSTSLLGSGNVAVQETLVSGTNIKTINSTSLLGSGNINIAANPSGVSGAIQFSDGSAFSSDASNFFWNNTTKRLGIGTNAPSGTAHFKGSGSTSATTSLLVQNSAGTSALSINDALVATFGNNVFATTFIGNIRSDNYLTSDGGFFAFRTSSTGNVRLPQSVSIGTSSEPALSASLDLVSTTKGFLPPRMTTTQKNAISSPAAGLVVYDSTTNKLCCYNGSTWNDLF